MKKKQATVLRVLTYSLSKFTNMLITVQGKDCHFYQGTKYRFELFPRHRYWVVMDILYR